MIDKEEKKIKCRFVGVECKKDAELVNKWNVPMCEPCHAEWVKIQLAERRVKE